MKYYIRLYPYKDEGSHNYIERFNIIKEYLENNFLFNKDKYELHVLHNDKSEVIGNCLGPPIEMDEEAATLVKLKFDVILTTKSPSEK